MLPNHKGSAKKNKTLSKDTFVIQRFNNRRKWLHRNIVREDFGCYTQNLVLHGHQDVWVGTVGIQRCEPWMVCRTQIRFKIGEYCY